MSTNKSEFYRVPDGVEKIGDRAFSGCAELTNITGWKSIGEIEQGFDESNGRLIIKEKGNWRTTEMGASHAK